jgi:hypothetical protein
MVIPVEAIRSGRSWFSAGVDRRESPAATPTIRLSSANSDTGPLAESIYRISISL